MHTLPRFGWAVGIVLALALTLTGCKKHKDAEPEPPKPQGNPLKPDPAGGPPAANDVQRGTQLLVIKNLMKGIGTYYQFYINEKGRPQLLTGDQPISKHHMNDTPKYDGLSNKNADSPLPDS